MRRKPWWFQKVPEAWRKQAEIWCSEDWKSHSRTGRACKDKMECGAHHQGSASLARYRRILEKREQRPVSEIEVYARGRMDEQQGTCNQRTVDRIAAYSKAIKDKHGEDYDWQNAAIDGEVVYKAGHGKRHGRYLIGNGMISTTTLLSEIRSSTDDSLNGSGPSKRLCLDTGSTTMDQLQSEMREMQESWDQELRLEREAREREMQLERDAWEQQLQEERTARQKEHAARIQEQNEHKNERAYFDSVISAIQQQLHLNLPPRPVPQ